MGSLDDLLVIPAVPESRDLQCEYGTDSDTEHNFGSVKGRRQMKQKERSGALMTPFTYGNNADDDPGNLQSSSMSEAVVQDLEAMQSELHHTEPDWSEFMFGFPQDKLSTPTNTRDFSHDTPFNSTVTGPRPNHRPAVYEMANDQDGDEDSHVRRNLWMSRMRRLGRLIAKVSELLDGDQWSAQKRLLQDVQLRFTGVMFGWQH
ncbi:hypothetical protein FOIG_06230 [Fusarium odoratissimum NRRL 54006]|uniref:Uncharacterized protein n=2 Tax=Fusarium oxysporum species complex TaxID=171631 RepID=X0K3X1_FUSO5|nr:uncharacterized protein FOIG_06230 [Fusarium odoratissimum NRRL 54006]EXM03422.1 hypothetical protein FOIG_06230 [Fusarium odoratissimum NRRL 54006]TXC11547.1 hypothetical protein FocTR4_00007468 [Fusarium oxysporum f. sp. cubense]